VRPGRRSRTAEAAAAARAAHLVLDADPPVLADRYAARLLGFGEASSLLQVSAFGRMRDRIAPAWLERSPLGAARRIRAQVVVRSRYAEDQLEAALDRRVDQYVILAAGLDSFALRRPELVDRVTVFEVDHPASQAWKQARLTRVADELPPHLVFVPIDFERQALAEALAAVRYDASRPTFFSWLGTTYYLTAAALRETLHFVAAQAPGSELVFDYWSPSPPSATDRALLAGIRFAAAWQGEPMHSFLSASDLRRAVEACGLKLLEDLDAGATGERYLARRPDRLALPEFAHLAHVANR